MLVTRTRYNAPPLALMLIRRIGGELSAEEQNGKPPALSIQAQAPINEPHGAGLLMQKRA